MRVLIINEVVGHTSTGRICAEQADQMIAEGNQVRIAYGRDDCVPDQYRNIAIRIGSDLDVKCHGVMTRLLDRHGLGSAGTTGKFLEWATQYDPELLCLHNLHGYYINYELLFRWIKSRPMMKVRWLLHDCWSFTGHCTFFTYIGCEKWKTQCGSCPQKRNYPAALLRDDSSGNYKRKQRAFTGVRDLTIITPSHWLAGIVAESFLSEYPVEVIPNTVDRQKFRPVHGSFRQDHGIEQKKVVLGISNAWHDMRKGFQDYLKLAELLGEEYVVLLVGLSDRQAADIRAENVLTIGNVSSEDRLAEIYTAADVMVNLTYEDNYPSINIEAQACGTPVITYRTGGSPESVPPENVVDTGDIRGAAECVRRILAGGKPQIL